jgi:hypothetical protein
LAVTKLTRWLLLSVVASVLVVLVAPTLVTAAGPDTGYIEVCKASDGSAVTGTFRFTVAAQTVDVPVGACSAALQLPVGVVTVTEEAVAGVGVVDITASPADRLVSTSVSARSAQVTVVSGGIANESLVTFTNRAEMGVLAVCKVAGPGIAAGTNFTFVVGGRSIAVPAGQCGAAGSFPYGSNVTISEVLERTTRVSDIEVSPAARLVGAPSLTDGIVTVAIGPGLTQAAFTNEAVPQGLLQICKRSDDPGLTGTFTFTVADHRVDVPVGLCSSLLAVPEGPVTVTELSRSDTLVSGITTSPVSRLVQANLVGASAQVRIVAGSLAQMATVTFTNALRTSQVKVCKVAGRGVTLGTPFSFNVAGRVLSVPAGSCVLAGAFPLNSVVTVTETIPPGMQVGAITVSPPERASGAPNLTAGTVAVVAGSGVTEVAVMNQTTAPPPTAVTTTTAVPLAITTTVPLPTTTIPLSPSSTIATTPTTLAPLASTTTTLAPAVTSTTAPAATTSTTSRATTTSTVVPLVSTSTTVGLLATSTTVAPLATTSTTVGLLATTSTTAASTTVPPATTSTISPLLATSTTAVPLVNTSTTVASSAVTSTTVANVATTTTVAPCVTATTAPMSTTTTTTPGMTTPTSVTTIGPGTATSAPCAATFTLSSPGTVGEQQIPRLTSLPVPARLALTGSSTGRLLAGACVALLVGAATVLVVRMPQGPMSRPGLQRRWPRTRRHTRSRFSLSSPPRFAGRTAPLHRARHIWRL